jgi:L-rhamnose mutarotase
MKRYCLAVDLVDDPAKIREYEDLHRAVWPEILDSIKLSGILDMQIYRTGNRLCMVMETEDDFNFERKALSDRDNPDVQRWEEFMWDFQQPLSWAEPGQKWVLMEQIFQL